MVIRTTPRDYDLRPAQPSAARFLDILVQVQFLVSNLIELALAECDRQALAAFSTEISAPELSASSDCIRDSVLRRKSVDRGESPGVLSTKPAVLRTRRRLRPVKDGTYMSIG